MMMKEVIEEINRFVDNHDKTDYPMFVYYEPLKTDEKGNVLKNTGFLTTSDKSILIKSNIPYVTFYGKEHISKWDMRVWLLDMVPISEIKSIETIEKFHEHSVMDIT